MWDVFSYSFQWSLILIWLFLFFKSQISYKGGTIFLNKMVLKDDIFLPKYQFIMMNQKNYDISTIWQRKSTVFLTSQEKKSKSQGEEIKDHSITYTPGVRLGLGWVKV